MFVAAIRDPAGAIMNYVGVQVEVRRKIIKDNVKWTWIEMKLKKEQTY